MAHITAVIFNDNTLILELDDRVEAIDLEGVHTPGPRPFRNYTIVPNITGVVGKIIALLGPGSPEIYSVKTPAEFPAGHRLKITGCPQSSHITKMGRGLHGSVTGAHLRPLRFIQVRDEDGPHTAEFQQILPAAECTC